MKKLLNKTGSDFVLEIMTRSDSEEAYNPQAMAEEMTINYYHDRFRSITL